MKTRIPCQRSWRLDCRVRVHLSAGLPTVAAVENIGATRLYRPAEGAAYAGLDTVLSRPINWELIAQQYDQMVKYATVLRLGTAEAEQILRRFNGRGPKHPTWRSRNWGARCARHLSPTIWPTRNYAGRSTKACRSSSSGTRPMARSSTAATPSSPAPTGNTRRSPCWPCTYCNPRLCWSTPDWSDRVLDDPQWAVRMTVVDRRGLTPLFWSNVALHGRFDQNVTTRIDYDLGPRPPNPDGSPPEQRPGAVAA